MANSEFCVATATTYYTTGKCCSGMTSVTDLCNAAYPFSTYSQLSAGAKFNKCALSTSCGSTTSYTIVKGIIKDYSVKISAVGNCNFQIYYSLVDTTQNFNYKDWHSYADDITGGVSDLTTLKGYFVISRDTTAYPKDTRFFSYTSAGLYTNVTEGST